MRVRSILGLSVGLLLSPLAVHAENEGSPTPARERLVRFVTPTKSSAVELDGHEKARAILTALWIAGQTSRSIR